MDLLFQFVFRPLVCIVSRYLYVFKAMGAPLEQLQGLIRNLSDSSLKEIQKRFEICNWHASDNANTKNKLLGLRNVYFSCSSFDIPRQLHSPDSACMTCPTCPAHGPVRSRLDLLNM